MKPYAPYLFALLFAVAFTLSQHQLLSVSSPQIAVDDAAYHAAKMPYSLKTPGRQMLHFKATVSKHFLTTTQLKIIPDDCIETLRVNDRAVDVSRLPGRCNWSQGAQIDLAPYLHAGDNLVQITVLKKDGVGGLNLFGVPDLYNPAHIVLQFLAMLGLAGLILTVTRKSLSLPLGTILAAGALLQLHYLSYTDYATRTFDLLISTGHLDYIRMIAHQLTLPNPTQGWEYHQPPLYYLLAAAVYRVFELIPLIDPLVALQLFSLLLFILFLYFALRTLTLLIPDRIALGFAAVLLVFWPSGIIHSVRIGNDILFFTLFSAGLYAAVRWQTMRSGLKPALLLAALALVTKANGIILFGLIGVLLLTELYAKRDLRNFLKQSAVTILFFLAAFLINFADNIYYAFQGAGSDWLVSNVVNTINRKLYVANDAFNYLYFDLKTYLKEPFINPWDDRYGRQFFWNYLFKSALFSEFFFASKHVIASVMGALSLLLFGYIMTGLLTVKPTRGALIMALALFLSLAALLVYRIKIPVACNTDFRYIYPSIIPMAFFFTQAQAFFRTHRLRPLYYGGYIVVLLFSVGTVAVFF